MARVPVRKTRVAHADPTHLQTTKRVRLSDHLVDGIRALVASGRYRIGDRLPPEAELGVLFGAGRSTVREAMRVLANRGLVEIRHGEGTFVTSAALRESFEERLERAKLDDIYEARVVLELALAGLAAERRTRRDIAAMRTALKRRVKAGAAGDVAAYGAADFAFHLAVAKAARNAALYSMYESFVQSVQRALSPDITPDYIRNENDPLHAGLCDAIAAGNVAAARRLVRRHLRTSLEGIAAELRR